MKRSTQQLLAFIATVTALSPDNGYLRENCGGCYYYSDITCKTCDHEHEPTTPETPACVFFEPREEWQETKEG